MKIVGTRFALIILVFFSALARSEGAVQASSHVVFCKPSSTNSFSGYYSLDYLAQYNPSLKTLNPKSVEEHWLHFETFIQWKLPELFWSFVQFQNSFFEMRWTGAGVETWEEAVFGLVDLKDQNLVTLLPENCRDGDVVHATPVIVFVPKSVSGLKYDYFRYSKTALEELMRTSPLQASFVLLRGYLSMVSDNVDRNRRINYWFHSVAIDNWSRKIWNESVEALGLELPQLSPPYFVSGYCTHDKTAAQKFYSKVRTEKKIRLATGKPYGFDYTHYDDCDPAANPGKCSYVRFEDYTNYLRDTLFQTTVEFEFQNNEIWVAAQVPGTSPLQKTVQFLTCKFDETTGEMSRCSAATDRNGNPVPLKNPFFLMIGQNCMKALSPAMGRKGNLVHYGGVAFIADL